jgi:hypothetical protein
VATVAVQGISRTGVAPTYAAASAGGDAFRPGERTFVHVKNGGTAAITATIPTPGTVSGFAVADLAVSVPAGGERMIGPVSPDLFRSSTDGLAGITWSAVTSVTFAVLAV